MTAHLAVHNSIFEILGIAIGLTGLLVGFRAEIPLQASRAIVEGRHVLMRRKQISQRKAKRESVVGELRDGSSGVEPK